jgi:uncharacterized protein DUF3179
MRQWMALGLWLAAVLLAGFVGVGGLPAPLRGQAAPAEAIPFDTSEWKTDFTKHSVSLAEISSGGPPKNGIPAIDKPEFDSVDGANAWLKPREPVIFFTRGDDARAYPLQILIWHEIVNDTVAGAPVAITFCPLCHTAIAFDRRAAGRTLDFGTTGKLRFSDLVMYDRETESWWQQATGEAVVGTLTGTRLTPLPAQIVSWATFRQAFPAGKALSRRTGFRRTYGQNPYVGYDDVNASPFLYRGATDPRLRPMERVVTVSIGSDNVAYPFRVLEKIGVVNDRVGAQPIAVFYERGVTSALDQGSIPESRDVGTAGVFERTVNGRVLAFQVRGNRITDAETGTTWTILGTGAHGPLAGTHLVPVLHGQYFWFAWAVFRPATRVYQPH